jgi:hypothetical protein
MAKRIFSLLWLTLGLGVASSFGAVALSQPLPARMSEPAALALFGGVIFLLTTLSRRKSA